MENPFPKSGPSEGGVGPPCVAVGASGGAGLDDIKELLHALPAPLPAVVMVVLHRPVDRLSDLRAVLARATRMDVRIAEHDEILLPGTIYIGQPAHHLTLIARSRAGLRPGPANEYRNRTIDMLFRSLAEFAGPAAIGVVLSGALDDGARGLAAIHAAKGVTMVLTPNRDRPPGMPENAIDYDGQINVIGSPGFIAKEIVRLLGDPRFGSIPAREGLSS